MPEAEPTPESSDASIEDRIAALLDGDGESEEEQESQVAKATDDSPAAEEGDEAPEGDEQDAEGDEDAGEDDGEKQAGVIETVDDLAKTLGVETADLLAQVSVKGPDGKLVPLADVVSAFEKAPDAVRISTEVQAKQAALEADRGKLMAEYDKRLGHVQMLAQQLMGQLRNEPKIDWDQLKEDDPVEWLRQRQLLADKNDAIKASMAEMEQEHQRRQAEEAKLREEFRAGESAKLAALMPEWKKPEVAEAAAKEMSAWLTAAGFKPEELGGGFLDDSRVVLAVWKAAQYDKLHGKGKAKLELAKGRELPRVLKPTARKEVLPAAVQKRVALRRRLARTGSERDAAALIEEML